MKDYPPLPPKVGPILPINQIICGDCVEVMSGYPSDSIDLTITSPPYDKLRDYQGYKLDILHLITQLYRVTKKGGVVVWVVGDATVKGSETGTSFKQALCFMDIGFNLHDTMIYEKNSFSNPSFNRYHQVWEYMFVFSKGKPKTFNPIKDKKNKWAGHQNWGKNTIRQKDGTLIERPANIINEYGMRHNIWKFNTGGNVSTKDKIAFKHPAIFPDKLARDHILSWSNEGDLVLDPMCGSGTTCKMAKVLNRKYIGIDMSEEYCEIARERVRD